MERHALCLVCGDVLHVPVEFASSRRAARELGPVAWSLRLASGCRVCAGALSSIDVEGCEECERWRSGDG